MSDLNAVKIIARAINEVQRECPRIGKDGTNTHFKYDYVSEEGLVELIRESCIKHGLLLTPSVDSTQQFTVHTGQGNSGNGVMVTWVQEFHLTHMDGHVWPYPIKVLAQGTDQGDKACWKGLTSAHKYAWMRLLMLPTGDDPEADAGTDHNYAGRSPHAKQPVRAPRMPSPARSAQAEPSVDVSDYTPPPPGAAPPTSNLRPGDAELAQWVNDIGPTTELEPDDYRKWGIYVKAFKAAERVHGDSIKTDKSLKFSCLDDYKAERGINRDNPFQAQHIQGFFFYAEDGWYKFEQVQAPTPPYEDQGWADQDNDPQGAF